jgi:hypothetical protein
MVMYCTVMYCTLLLCTVLYSTLLYSTALYCTVRLQNLYAGSKKYQTKYNNNKSSIRNLWKSVIQAIKAQKESRGIALLFL